MGGERLAPLVPSAYSRIVRSSYSFRLRGCCPSGFAPDTLCALRYAALACAAVLGQSEERTVWTFPLFF
jgi:hypothetical protein